MGLTDLWSRKKEGPESKPEISLRELDEKYELVKVDDTPGKEFAIVTERLTNELGSSSASPWTSFTRQEYNPALQGLRGLEMFDKMRKSDGSVRGSLRAVKTPALAARWFMEPGGKASVDTTAANLIWRNLNEMTITWTQVLIESLLMLDFGYYMFEKVWEPRIVDGQPRMWLRKLAPRHPMDVKEWKLDAHGGPVAVVMHPSNPSDPDVIIPIEKLLVFTFDRESGNIEGTSVLRSAYKHWYFKEQFYKIDAIQKERHGIGIPVIKLPMGYKDEDKLAAENLGRNIRTNERAHIVLPPGWEVLMLKLEGNPVDCLKSIEHHDDKIRENILVNFAKGGAKEEDIAMFLKASRFVADIVSDTFNAYLVPQMTDYNFQRAKYPKLRARRIGEHADQRTQSFTLRNMIGAGVIIPDDTLEASVRNSLDLPEADPSTARVVAAPQGGPRANQRTPNRPGPPRVGPPRQAPVGRQTNVTGTPRGNSGTDQSGGN